MEQVDIEKINYVSEGERFFSAGDYDKAKEFFWSAVEKCPGDAQAWNNLAVVSLTQSNYKEAENYLRRALEVKPDFVEARHNLAETYVLKGENTKAAREFKKILDFKADDIPTIKRLAQIYISLGQEDKAKEILENSGNVGSMKAFIDSLWLGIKYYAMKDDLSTPEKLEKLVGTILKFIDGQNGRSRRYRLSSKDEDSGEEIILEDLYEAFYYKESPSFNVTMDDNKPELILTVGEHEDWLQFREALRTEMKAEGGCLGDFTQTKKVLKQNGLFSKYDFMATLKYFEENVGPCDCHVLRSVLV